jgi:hypothetical protein
LLRHDSNIRFLPSGWGIGLKEMQAEARLPNVTLVDRVEDEALEAFLSAADVWIIPYRKNVAGVSVPSRFYNLLAIGRPPQARAEKCGLAARRLPARETDHHYRCRDASGDEKQDLDCDR